MARRISRLPAGSRWVAGWLWGEAALPLRFYELVDPLAPVEKAIRLLGTRAVEHAAVVDDEGVLLAVLSVKDIGRFVVEAFEEAGVVERFDFKAVLETPVYELASQPPLVVKKRDPDECAAIMLDKGIGFLPVVDEEGRLVDACTELDYAPLLAGDERPARCYATHELVMGDPSDTVIEALGVMVEKGVRRLPLRHGGEYYMATMTRLLLAIAREQREETLLRELVYYASPSPRLSYEEATVGEAAELVLSTPERSLLLVDREGLARAILTERDILRAYGDKGAQACSQQEAGK